MSPRTIGYCQACQNFITDNQTVTRRGSLFYHARCVSHQPAIAPLPMPKTDHWRLLFGTCRVACGCAFALFSFLSLVIVVVVYPFVGIFAAALIFGLVAQANQRAFVRTLVRESIREGVRELAKYRR